MDHYEPPSRTQRTHPQRDRPPPPSYHDAPPPPSGPRDMFQFRGAAAASRPAADNYRPGPKRDGFNFSAGNNAPSFAPSDNYPGARRAPRDSRRGGHRNARGRGPPPRRFGPKPAHERDLMRRQREPTPDQLEGMNEGKESRFKVLDDISDSDDSAMDLEDDNDDDDHHPVDALGKASSADHTNQSDDSEDEHPRAKRARVKSKSPEAEQAKPKWSNPDPYTVLPPPGESDAKKKDVVKLIRKAKVEAAKPAAPAAEGEDFISLNFDDDFAQNDSEDEEGGISISGVSRDEPSLPHKPSFSHLDNLHPDRNVPPPPPAEAQFTTIDTPATRPLPRLDVWPPPADVHGDPSGRSQFHTGLQRQEAKDAAAPVRRDNNKKRKRRDDVGDGDIVEEWLTPVDTDPAPWFANQAQGTRAEQWLHNEILDFYNYVKPRDFENQVREDLVSRMDRAVRNMDPNLNVRAFGSFASGLYLPTADMDLVVCTTNFLNGGRASGFATKSFMHRFKSVLQRSGLAAEYSITVIANARVPLVKFVEKVTGLRVDVSFENDSGLLANNTFHAWKQQFPAMPIIVSLIKQFLVMRGQSEVFNGGLGGYSVICLTITILRTLEERHGRDWDPMQSLDTVLMTFLVYFGRDFNIEKHGIQMEPWKVVSKAGWRGANNKTSKLDRLLIIDPNNYANDISGGSGNIIKIFDKFADAFRELNICMSDAEDTQKENGDIISILERVWGGNYALFEAQRSRLRQVWQQNSTSGSNFPRGNNQGGNGHGGAGGSQGNPGNSNSGNQGKSSNQPKQAKRPADGDSKPSKKQKKNNDGNAKNQRKRQPLHTEYDRPTDEVSAEVPGPAGAAGKRKKSSDATTGASNPNTATQQPSTEAQQGKKKKKPRKEKKNVSAESTEKNRADSFKNSHPGVSNLPDRMDKQLYRTLTQKHGKGNA